MPGTRTSATFVGSSRTFLFHCHFQITRLSAYTRPGGLPDGAMASAGAGPDLGADPLKEYRARHPTRASEATRRHRCAPRSTTTPRISRTLKHQGVGGHGRGDEAVMTRGRCRLVADQPTVTMARGPMKRHRQSARSVLMSGPEPPKAKAIAPIGDNGRCERDGAH